MTLDSHHRLALPCVSPQTKKANFSHESDHVCGFLYLITYLSNVEHHVVSVQQPGFLITWPSHSNRLLLLLQ